MCLHARRPAPVLCTSTCGPRQAGESLVGNGNCIRGRWSKGAGGVAGGVHTRRKTEHVGMPGPESHKPHITLTPEGWAARIGFHSHRRVSVTQDGDTHLPFSYTRKCEGRPCKRTGAPPKLLRMTRSYMYVAGPDLFTFTVTVSPVVGGREFSFRAKQGRDDGSRAATPRRFSLPPQRASPRTIGRRFDFLDSNGRRGSFAGASVSPPLRPRVICR